MQQSPIKTSGHEWIKQNLITITRGGDHYDVMVCSHCGMKGKRYGFDTVEVSNEYARSSVMSCRKAPKISTKKIKVTLCRAQSRAFSNLTPGSVHDVVEPPRGYKNDASGVWVEGVGD